ncbi:methyltransferase family protein [Nocardia sp. NPDC052566]|uniref:methyltransferase family protein n=1 Tax=Nocardia sp. NPDC052566 TaxID=3364330 RepID=UPI0037C63AB8
MSAWRQVRAILALPGTVVLMVPTIMAVLGGVRFGWELPGVFATLLVIAGALLAVVGGVTFGVTVALFARAGGTLAPWDPPQELVVAGPYRYIRNPMISGVFAALAGEACVLGSWWILGWFGFFVLAQNIYIRFDEEPTLVARFGESYAEYRNSVPRWLPRPRVR